MDHPEKKSATQPPRLLVLGGGFAGVWAAIAAAEAAAALGPVQIDVVSPDDRFVPRPRLYESAPADTARSLRGILGPRGIGHLRAQATDIDDAARTVTIVDDAGTEDELLYDRLILATGSQLRRPPIDAAHLHDIDTLPAAEALDRRLAELPEHAIVVVVGAGFVGIELACELPTRVPSAHVVLLERSDVIAPELGANPRPEIEAALHELKIETRTGVTIAGFDGSTVTLDDGGSFPADVVVWTAGMSASPLTATLSTDLDPLGRLDVDQYLRVQDVPFVFAAGDTAAPLDEAGHPVAQSAQHAIPQGSCAGRNAVADLHGVELIELTTLPYGTCLDLGAAGAVFTEGWERQVRLVGDDAKAIKNDITTTWLYPPSA